MNKAIRISLGAAIVAMGLGLVNAPAANAQVRFQGSFPLPHGRISISLPDPFFPLRSFVPDGYSVYDDAQYGYGFYSGDEWIPCERFDDRWVISGRPIFLGHRDYRYVRPYRDDYRYSQQYRRGFDSRNDYGYSPQYRRGFDSRNDYRYSPQYRRGFDSRNDARWNRPSRDRSDDRFTRDNGGQRREGSFGRDSRGSRSGRDGRDSRRDPRRSDR